MESKYIQSYSPDTVKKVSSNYFETFFEHVTMGIVIADKRAIITDVNPFALKEFGYTKNELVGKRIEVLIPTRFHKIHLHHHQKFLAHPQPWPMGAGKEVFGLKNDGTEFPIEISLSNYQVKGKSYVMAFLVNITVRKKTEAEILTLNDELESTVVVRTKALEDTLQRLELTNVKLEEAIQFQKAILDNAGAMIIATNKEGNVTLFNQEASRCLGYDESEIINKKTPLVFHDMAEIERKRKELMNEFGIYVEDEFSVIVEMCKRNVHKEEQYTHIRKDGTRFFVSLTLTALHGKNAEITGYIGVVFDITERKKVEEALMESLKKEKSLSELKSRFVTMASHEFRTPLSTVLSSAYLIEKYSTTEDQPKREKHLQRIVSSVNMLSDILNDFLSVGKIEEGKIQVRFTQFSIKELILSIVGEMESSLQKQQKIRYRHEGNPEVVLDVSLLKHIVMNLLSNASKFSPEKRPIEITTSNQSQQVSISVKDYGIGISQADQQHLMERFFRGANAGNIKGTGLGLNIVSKYVELMEGTLQCTSELEKGTEFVITFRTKILSDEKDIAN